MKKTGDKIRNLGMAGVKVDEDFKRFIHMMRLPLKYWGLPELTIRESSDLR